MDNIAQNPVRPRTSTNSTSREHCYQVVTFAMRHIGGSIKVSGGVPRTGDAVVLAKLRLVGSSRAANAAVSAGVVVMSRSTVH